MEFESPRLVLESLKDRMLRDEPMGKAEAESCHRHRVAAGIGVPTGRRRQDQKGRSQDRQGDLGAGITVGGSCWAASWLR